MFCVLLSASAHTQTTMTTAPLGDALNKLVPTGWELFVRNDIPEKRIVGWKASPDWQIALAQIADNHNLDIRVNALQKKVFVDPKPPVGGLAAIMFANPPTKSEPAAPAPAESSKTVAPTSPVESSSKASTGRRFTVDMVNEVGPDGFPDLTPQPATISPALATLGSAGAGLNPSSPPVASEVAPPVVKLDTSMTIVPMRVREVFEQVVRRHGYAPDWQIDDKAEPYRTSHNVKVPGDSLEGDLVQLQKAFGAGRDSPFLLDIAKGNRVVLITERK